MPLSPTDQLHLNTATGFLQIGESMDAWEVLERITPLNRTKTEVPAMTWPRAARSAVTMQVKPKSRSGGAFPLAGMVNPVIPGTPPATRGLKD